jgi:hypothetical protein
MVFALFIDFFKDLNDVVDEEVWCLSNLVACLPAASLRPFLQCCGTETVGTVTFFLSLPEPGCITVLVSDFDQDST